MDIENMDMGIRSMVVKNNRNKIIGIVSMVALINLIGLFVVPDWIESRRTVQNEVVNYGDGKAKLEISSQDRTFNGKGIFDAMEGVNAYDIDGTCMKDRIALTYTSKESIQNKEIHYIVYDSKNEKLEDVASLFLEGYKGPSLKLSPIHSVTWDELQKMNETMIEKGLLQADDGFGNDANQAVTFSFELLPETKSAKVTFSLINQFQDCHMEKMIVSVEDFPQEY